VFGADVAVAIALARPTRSCSSRVLNRCLQAPQTYGTRDRRCRMILHLQQGEARLRYERVVLLDQRSDMRCA
jgi:hypothetical protein